MTNLPSTSPRLEGYAEVLPPAVPGRIVITGVDFWNTHAVIYATVDESCDDSDFAAADAVQFDDQTHALGPLTVYPPPAGSVSRAYSTTTPANRNARSVSLVFTDTRVSGLIGPVTLH